ncbi:hypothetical protein Tco_0653196 [Tanacetum coccineum]|uniref:Uncharacterized protein n=1 Tax=Tanacetum coccineum TaxID=301880 RepID=A0ABQ4WZN9_9ASTR
MRSRTSYDSNTPSEVHDHDTFENHLDEYHEVHEMQTYEQHNYVVDYADYTSNSNNISYDQYMERTTEIMLFKRDVLSYENDALMSIIDEIHDRVSKSKTEEVTLLKKDFKQKEDKFLEEFLDIKKLKDKIEDRLYKQDQSVQTVHMLCQPKSFYDEKHKVAIGYKNPLCLARAKQAQSALYNGGQLLFATNHAPTIIQDSRIALELAAKIKK